MYFYNYAYVIIVCIEGKVITPK